MDENKLRVSSLSVAGIRTLRSCGASLLFDRSLGDCNIATAVRCVRDPVISINFQKNFFFKSIECVQATVCTTFNGFVRIGDPGDCTKFYTCLNGLSYHQTCAAGLY